MRFLVRLVGLLARALVALALVGIILFFVLPRVLHWDVQVVLSGSMEPAMPVGSVVLVRPVDPEAVAVGDIITFGQQGSPDFVTHRVVEVLKEESLSFRTRGDANEEPDTSLVPADALRGRVWVTIPYLGYVAQHARQPWGFLLLVGVPGGLIIADEVFHIFSTLRRGRQEKHRPQQVNQRSHRPRGLAIWLALGGIAVLAVAPALLRTSAAEHRRQERGATRPRRQPALWTPLCFVLLTVGLVGTGAGFWASGSYALFSDSETSSGNTLQAAAFFETVTISKDLIVLNDADGDGKIEVGERVEFTLSIAVKNVSTDQTVTDAVVSDAFGAELEIVNTVPSVGSVSISTVGASAKPFLTWDIGTLDPGREAALTVVAATDVNPGGHQEYSEAGAYQLNSGATLKALANGKQISVTSDAVWAEVVEANTGQSQDSNPTPSSTPATGITSEYEVQPGDTLTDIAARFGTTVEALTHLNGLEDPGVILYGSTLKVPYVGEDAGSAAAGLSPQHRRASVRGSSQ